MTEESAKLMTAKAAMQLLKENAQILDQAESLEITLTVPLKNTPLKARVSMMVRIEESV